MRKRLNIHVFSLLILIYFSNSVLAAVPMFGMILPAVTPMNAHANHTPMSASAGHCLSGSFSESHSENTNLAHSAHPATESSTALSQHTSPHGSEMSSHCDAKCQCCIGSCSTLALLSISHSKPVITSPVSSADFDLQLLPQHPASLFKPPIFC